MGVIRAEVVLMLGSRAASNTGRGPYKARPVINASHDIYREREASQYRIYGLSSLLQ